LDACLEAYFSAAGIAGDELTTNPLWQQGEVDRDPVIQFRSRYAQRSAPPTNVIFPQSRLWVIGMNLI